MAVWTISAQIGTGDREIAAELAERADVPLLDRASLVRLANELDPDIGNAEELEARLGGRLMALTLGAAIATGAPDAVRELRLRKELPELGRIVLREATRQPAVVVAPARLPRFRTIRPQSMFGCARRSNGGSRRTSGSKWWTDKPRRRR